MGCVASMMGGSVGILPLSPSKNKYAIESPPGSEKNTDNKNSEETPETNNESSASPSYSPIVVRKSIPDKVIEEDIVRGFEDPEDDDIEDMEKAKVDASPGKQASQQGKKVETAEEWLRNHSENRTNNKALTKSPNKSTIYNAPGGNSSLKLTAWD